MLRSRVRRSFTVEVKSKSRQISGWPDDPAPSPVDWAALDLKAETPSAAAASRLVAAASAVPPAVAERPRRILPSLIVAEAEPDEPAPAVEREARLPRVRRVKPAAPPSDAAGPNAARPEAAWSFADVCDAPAPVPPAQPRTPAPAPAPAPSVSPPVRKAARSRASDAVLAPGERWKRRLPWVCR